MPSPLQDPYQGSSRLVVMLVTIAVFLCFALLAQYALAVSGPADLCWKLAVISIASVLIAFVVSNYTASGGGNGSLGLAVFAAIGLLLLSAVLTILASQTQSAASLDIIKSVGVWSIFACVTLYLAFITFN